MHQQVELASWHLIVHRTYKMLISNGCVKLAAYSEGCDKVHSPMIFFCYLYITTWRKTLLFCAHPCETSMPCISCTGRRRCVFSVYIDVSPRIECAQVCICVLWKPQGVYLESLACEMLACINIMSTLMSRTTCSFFQQYFPVSGARPWSATVVVLPVSEIAMPRAMWYNDIYIGTWH